MRLSSLLCICLLLRLSNSQEAWDCGPPCKCKWVSGKKTADCTRQNYTHIPNYLSPDIQNLDLTLNRISHVQKGAFSDVGLVNLQKLLMRNCGIRTIDSNAFNGLKIVIEIDLSENYITNLIPNTFLETQKLRLLLLSHNLLKSLDDGLFRNLDQLQRVEISQNHLEHIAENTFQNLPGLLTLTLNDNNITNVQLGTFKNLPKLGSLELRNNPWHCNCHLKKFRNWTLERKLYTKGTTCFLPEALAGKGWDDVDSDDFACPPEILLIGKYPQVGIGDNVTMWCHASGIPRPQLSWVHRSRVLNNSTKRHTSDRGYYLLKRHEWLNLTITGVVPYDQGEYICIAKNLGGSVERNLTLTIANDIHNMRANLISLPLALGLGVTLLIFLLFFLILCTWYWRRKKRHESEKSADVTSLEHHGLGEQEKSLITAINPVVKPPRRYEAPSVTSHGTEMTELNRTLLDNDSVFADGVGSVIGVMGGIVDDRTRATPELNFESSTLLRGTSYRHYPPDLLAFSGGRGASPTSQASTLPDTRSSNHYQHSQLHQSHPHPQQSPSHHQPQQQQQQQQSPRGFSPSSGQYPAAFKTLPHNLNRQMTVYNSPVLPVMPRHGYVTIPRRPRAPSWSSGPPSSPVDHLEPVYDNLGARTTADGSSVLSLNKINKSPEPVSSMRMRPLPSTPTSAKPQTPTPTPTSLTPLSPLTPPRLTPTPPGPGSTPITSLPPTSTRFNSLQRSTPNIFNSSSISTNNISNNNGNPSDRSAPEGAAEWYTKLPDEMEKRVRRESASSPLPIASPQTPTQTTTPSSSLSNTTTNTSGTNTLGRKIPPRPPPKPKKKSANGPLYEDEGEDGTEV